MQRILWYAMAMVGFLVCVMVVVVSVSHGSTVDAPIMGLADCAGHPCMLNITLDRTTWSDAVDRFKNQPNAKLRGNKITDRDITVNQDETTIIRFEESGGYISLFDLDFTGDQRPALGAMINYFGIPCRVIATSLSYITLYYPHSLVYVRTAATKTGLLPRALPALHLDTPISGFNMEASMNSCGRDRDTYTNWQGFASLWRYLAAD